MDEELNRVNDAFKASFDRIQRIFDLCIAPVYEALVDRVFLNCRYYGLAETIEFEKKEYNRISKELIEIHVSNPVLVDLQRYYADPEFFWESGLFEYLQPADKRKYRTYLHTQFDYSKYVQNNTFYDNELPYFSVIVKVVAYERFLDSLRIRTQGTLGEIEGLNGMVPVALEIPAKPKVETDNPFEQSFISVQLNLMAECANEVKMFNAMVTHEDWKAIFDCKPNNILKSKNNRLLAYFFSSLSNRNLITGNWQSVIAKYKLFLASQKNDYLNCNDLANANANNKDVQLSYKYTVIGRYIKQLQKTLG